MEQKQHLPLTTVTSEFVPLSAIPIKVVPANSSRRGIRRRTGLSLFPSSLVDVVALIFFTIFLPMSDEPLLVGATLVAVANGTLRAEAVAFVDVAQQRNT